MLLIMILGSLFAGIRMQEITTTGCGTAKACIKEPSTCTSSSDCQFLITWKRSANVSSKMDFEVSSKHATGWVALGFNMIGPQMVDTKGEICYFDNSQKKFSGFVASYRSTPAFSAAASNTVLQSMETVNGAIICRFSRPLQGSAYQNNLDSSIFPIIATGSVTSGTVNRHSAKKAFQRVDFSAHGAATTTLATTTLATTTPVPTTTMEGNATATTTGAASMISSVAGTTQPATTHPKTQPKTQTNQSYTSTTASTYNATSTTFTATSSMAPSTIDLASCGKTKGCFRHPPSCDTFRSCNFIATWQADQSKKQVRIELKGSQNAWVAFGLNTVAKAMIGTYGEICYMSNSNSTVKAFHATVQDLPSISNTQPSSINVHGIEKSEGIICRFTRPWMKTDAYSIDVNRDAYVIMASGNSVNGGRPSYHMTARVTSSSKYNIASQLGGTSDAMKQGASLFVFVAAGCFHAVLLALVV